MLDKATKLVNVEVKSEYRILDIFEGYRNPKNGRYIDFPCSTIVTVEYDSHEEVWQAFELKEETIRMIKDAWAVTPIEHIDNTRRGKTINGEILRLSSITEY